MSCLCYDFCLRYNAATKIVDLDGRGLSQPVQKVITVHVCFNLPSRYHVVEQLIRKSWCSKHRGQRVVSKSARSTVRTSGKPRCSLEADRTGSTGGQCDPVKSQTVSGTSRH